MKIYFAGKVRPLAGEFQSSGSEDWRGSFLSRDFLYDTDNWGKSVPVTLKSARVLLGMELRFEYCGPFFDDLWHPHFYYDGPGHGIAEERRAQVVRRCLSAIDNADVVFAWIDSSDAYGTLAEIGYAKSKGKAIWIVTSDKLIDGPGADEENDYMGSVTDDLWFVVEMAEHHRSNVKDVKETFFDMLLRYGSDHFLFKSPIEQRFWDHWISLYSQEAWELIPQYQIGRYYVDFAHVRTKTAIELDGFATHSSTTDIARDRKRQREIEKKGWHVLRFGGKEIHANVHACVEEVQLFLNQREPVKQG